MTEQVHDMPQSHLEPHEVVAYLERTLPAADRARVEAHLAACEDCSSEIAEVWRLWRRGVKPTSWLPIGLAAAAVIAVVVLMRPAGNRAETPAPDVLRGSERASAVITVAPADSVVVQGQPVLVWRPVAGATGYRVT
ncbi:MAG: zf-HC2 domain-containing protein, partial [Deltaproteobacteria bacterium]